MKTVLADYGRQDDAANAPSSMETRIEYITMEFAALDLLSGPRCADIATAITWANAETDDKRRRSIYF